MKMSIGSVFVDLYQEMRQRLYQVDKTVQAKIVKDLKSSCQNQFDFNALNTVLQCVAFVFPQMGY